MQHFFSYFFLSIARRFGRPHVHCNRHSQVFIFMSVHVNLAFCHEKKLGVSKRSCHELSPCYHCLCMYSKWSRWIKWNKMWSGTLSCCQFLLWRCLVCSTGPSVKCNGDPSYVLRKRTRALQGAMCLSEAAFSLKTAAVLQDCVGYPGHQAATTQVQQSCMCRGSTTFDCWSSLRTFSLYSWRVPFRMCLKWHASKN